LREFSTKGPTNGKMHPRGEPSTGEQEKEKRTCDPMSGVMKKRSTGKKGAASRMTR